MLVSVDELRRYMGGFNPTSGLEQEMVNILTGVQQQLEAYLNRPVELVQVREVVQTDSKGSFYLSVTPVRKIISYGVNVDTSTPPTTVLNPYEIEADELIGDDGRIIDKSSYKLSRPDYFTHGSSLLTAPLFNTSYLIEYIGGLDGRQYEDIKLAIKRVAAREYTQGYVDTAGLRTGQIEAVEVGDNRNIGWTDVELKKLERHRRRVAR